MKDDISKKSFHPRHFKRIRKPNGMKNGGEKWMQPYFTPEKLTAGSPENDGVQKDLFQSTPSFSGETSR